MAKWFTRSYSSVHSIHYFRMPTKKIKFYFKIYLFDLFERQRDRQVKDKLREL